MPAIHSTGKMLTAAHTRAIAVYSAPRLSAPGCRRAEPARLEGAELAAGDLVEAIGEHEEEDPDDHGRGGRGPEVPEIEHRLVDEQARGLGGAARPPTGEQENRVEPLESLDDAAPRDAVP